MDFSDAKIQQVWEKGKIVGNNDSKVWRKDACGAWIRRDKYGDESSIYGWQVDHIIPVSKGRNDHISNLQPLQWENNEAKGDGNLKCAVKSDGNKNVKVEN